MLSVINQALVENALVNASVKSSLDVNVTGLKTSDAILHLLSQHHELTRQQLADIIGKDIRTIGRAITKLQQTGKLIRVGSDKTGHWEVQE